MTESAELARLVLLDEVAADGKSFFLGRLFAQAAAAGWRGVVSFSDPVPRRVAGRLLFPRHYGAIYQAFLRGGALGKQGSAQVRPILAV